MEQSECPTIESIDNVVDLRENPWLVVEPTVRINDQLLKCVTFIGLPEHG